MTKKRKLRFNERLKEAQYISELNEHMYEMSPHQLELLCSLAVKILNGDSIDK